MPAVLMMNLMAVFLFICCLVRSSLFRVCLTRTPITNTKMTKLKSRIVKMGPRKAPKNTAGSVMKQLEKRMTTQDIQQCLPQSYCSMLVMKQLEKRVLFWNICHNHLSSVTYNPWICGVGTRTTRSPLTASERSTASGITTGTIGTTKERRNISSSKLLTLILS